MPIENEQVKETTIQDQTVENEQTDATENKERSEEPTVEEETVSYTKTEYEKTLKSERSKAKYELLQEMGVKDVNDFKAKYSQYEESLKESEGLKADMQKIAEENAQLKNDLVLEKLNVAEEFKEDLITLAKAKTTDTNDFNSAVKEILEKNPNWVRSKDPVKLGTEKAEIKQESVSQELKKKYPWLH